MGYISVKDLNFSYNHKKKVLSNINIDINKGDWIAVLGHQTPYTARGSTAFPLIACKENLIVETRKNKRHWL